MLGCKVRDIVTGFIGVATVRHEYLSGFVSYSIEPRTENNVMEDSFSIDECRLEILEKVGERK